MTEILIKAMKKYWDSVFIALCSFTLRQLYLRERVSCTHKGEVWLDAKASLNPTAKINGACPASWKRVLLCCIHTHTHTHIKYSVFTNEWCGFKSYQEIYFSPYTSTTYTVSSGNCPSFSCATSSSLFMLTARPRGQFTRWRRSRKRLSVCSVLRCPHL